MAKVIWSIYLVGQISLLACACMGRLPFLVALIPPLVPLVVLLGMFLFVFVLERLITMNLCDEDEDDEENKDYMTDDQSED